jgi:hypothetical protein
MISTKLSSAEEQTFLKNEIKIYEKKLIELKKQ